VHLEPLPDEAEILCNECRRWH